MRVTINEAKKGEYIIICTKDELLDLRNGLGWLMNENGSTKHLDEMEDQLTAALRD